MSAAYLYIAGLPLATALLAAVLIVQVWPNRNTPIGRPIILFLFAAGSLALFYAAELLAPTLELKIWATRLEYIGGVLVAPFWCVAVLRWTDPAFLAGTRRVAMVLVVPAITLAAVFTNDGHGLVWHNVQLRDGLVPLLTFKYGPIFWLHTAYAFFLLTAGSMSLIRNALVSPRIQPVRVAVMILCVLPPWLADFAHIFKIGPFPDLDLLPTAFIFSMGFLYYGVTRLNFTRTVPVAREYVFERMQEAVFVIGGETLFDMNETGERLLGIDARAAIGKPAAAAFAGAPALERLLASPDGAAIRFDVNTGARGTPQKAAVSTMFDPRGKPLCRVIMCHDVSVEDRAAELLRQSEARFRGYFELGLVGMAITSPRKGWLDFNDHLCAMLGYTRDELATLTWAALTHPDDLDADLAQFNRVLNGEIDAYSLEKRFIRKDGQVVVVDLSVRCVRGPDGAVDHFIAMLHDISARKRAEEALRASEAKARSILNSTGAGMALIDRELKVVDCNEPFAARYGIARADAVDRKITDFVPEDIVAMRRIVAESVIDTGVPRQAIDEYNGVWNEYTVYPVKDDAGAITMVVIHSLDITDRVRLQEEKGRLEAQYQQAQKMEAIGQLAGGVAHDFNNLLQVIRGYTEVAQVHLAEDMHAQKLLGSIASAGERATTLVAQLLAFSRRQIIQPVQLDLNHVIADLTTMLERVIGENIRVQFAPAQALSGIRADRGMIEQVVMNLCINARDAMAEGGTLSIATEDVALDFDGCERFGLTVPGAYVLLSVSDTGCGMDAQTMERIYEPFFTTKEFGRGTGLGLATAYGILKQHDGTIVAESAVGQGTTFRVLLPAAERPEYSAAPQPERLAAGGAETILLAEDNEMVREFATTLLQRAGYTIIAAVDGVEAVELFERNTEAIDLALLDLMMPRMGGCEAFERIRAKRPGLPVIFATGFSDEAAHGEFSASDVLLLSKPYKAGELLHGIRNAFARAR